MWQSGGNRRERVVIPSRTEKVLSNGSLQKKNEKRPTYGGFRSGMMGLEPTTFCMAKRVVGSGPAAL
jgi:hypothetical protein